MIGSFYFILLPSLIQITQWDGVLHQWFSELEFVKRGILSFLSIISIQICNYSVHYILLALMRFCFDQIFLFLISPGKPLSNLIIRIDQLFKLLLSAVKNKIIMKMLFAIQNSNREIFLCLSIFELWTQIKQQLQLCFQLYTVCFKVIKVIVLI